MLKNHRDSEQFGHSARSTAEMSTRQARGAGSHAATAPTTTKTAAEPSSVKRSSGATPNSRVPRNRPPHTLSERTPCGRPDRYPEATAGTIRRATAPARAGRGAQFTTRGKTGLVRRGARSFQLARLHLVMKRELLAQLLVPPTPPQEIPRTAKDFRMSGGVQDFVNRQRLRASHCLSMGVSSGACFVKRSL
jgi:hypothetical protein